jgi:hypothetical protein
MNEIDLVEPYELPESEHTQTVVPSDAPPLDLSGYHYDLVLTYKMIEDIDDQDTLFRIQFLQAFGITDDEYHPEIVSAVIDDLYERFRENSGIRGILESHPLFHSKSTRPEKEYVSGADDDTTSEEVTDEEAAKSALSNTDDNSEMIFCMMFSFQLFDLFHACMRHAKHNEEIPAALRDEITECFRTMF